ncbi:MAG: TetR/AcrR family transcriptional regulator [Planctomycetota bacterium]
MQKRSSATYRRILDAALEHFLKRSFAAVTVDQVAASAGTTKGGVYHHFGSKEELYLAMLHRELERKAELCEKAVAMKGSCRERLARLTRDHFELPRRQRAAVTLVRRDVNRFEGKVRTRLVRAYQEALPGKVECILEDGIRDGVLPDCDARLLAWSFVALVEVSLSPHAGRIFPGVEEKLDHVLHLFFEGAALPGAPVSVNRKAS